MQDGQVGHADAPDPTGTTGELGRPGATGTGTLEEPVEPACPGTGTTGVDGEGVATTGGPTKEVEDGPEEAPA